MLLYQTAWGKEVETAINIRIRLDDYKRKIDIWSPKLAFYMPFRVNIYRSLKPLQLCVLNPPYSAYARISGTAPWLIWLIDSAITCATVAIPHLRLIAVCFPLSSVAVVVAPCVVVVFDVCCWTPYSRSLLCGLVVWRSGGVTGDGGGGGLSLSDHGPLRHGCGRRGC